MWLREDDGSLSELRSTAPMGKSEFIMCVRVDGTVIIAAPEDVFEGPDSAANGEVRVMVAWDDIVDAFLLAMHAEGLDHDTRARIVTTVRDAVDNNT
jgi:hypothetical protein